MAILVCHTAVNATQRTEGSTIAFVKPNDLERVEKSRSNMFHTYSLFEENWTVWRVRGAGTWGFLSFHICPEALSMQLREKESSRE